MPGPMSWTAMRLKTRILCCGRGRAGGLALAIAALAASGQSLAACRSRHDAPDQLASTSPSKADVAAWCVDVTAETGLTFRHVNGMSGQFYYPEILAPGVALFDYDNDGDLDVFLIQGGPLGSANLPPATRNAPPGGRLYR